MHLETIATLSFPPEVVAGSKPAAEPAAIADEATAKLAMESATDEAPAEPNIKVVTEAPTEPATQVVTEAPAEPAAEAATEAPAEPAVDTSTDEAVAEPATEATANALAEPAAEPTAEVKADAPKSEPVVLEQWSDDKFDELEAVFMALTTDPAKVSDLWELMGPSGESVRLSQVEKLIGDMYPLLDDRTALSRSYKQVTGARNVTTNSPVTTKDFVSVLLTMLYYNQVMNCFGQLATDSKQQIGVTEFQRGLETLGIPLGDSDAEGAFRETDTDGNGSVSFEEFVVWYINMMLPEEETRRSSAEFMSLQSTKAAAPGAAEPLPAQPEPEPEVLEEWSDEKFDELETMFLEITTDTEKLTQLWGLITVDLSNAVKISQVDGLISELYPLLKNKTALTLAYKQTCKQEAVNGDARVTTNHFAPLLLNLLYYNQCITCFGKLVTNSNHSIDLAEFRRGLRKLGIGDLSENDAMGAFNEADSDQDGAVNFNEFCGWYTKMVIPEDEIDESTAKFVEAMETKSAPRDTAAETKADEPAAEAAAEAKAAEPAAEAKEAPAEPAAALLEGTAAEAKADEPAAEAAAEAKAAEPAAEAKEAAAEPAAATPEGTAAEAKADEPSAESAAETKADEPAAVAAAEAKAAELAAEAKEAPAEPAAAKEVKADAPVVKAKVEKP